VNPKRRAKRFIDPKARFFFVAEVETVEGAVGFDLYGGNIAGRSSMVCTNCLGKEMKQPLPINNVSAPNEAHASERRVAFGEAFRFWIKLGFISFGGPAGQIAIMHRELVERRQWVSEERFLHALNYCMLLPGPVTFKLLSPLY
jgi:hypothetical protein